MAATDQNEHYAGTSPPASHGFFLNRPDRNVLIFALISLCAVRILAIFWLPFFDLTEARYAEIARKMLETGDWITPQFDYDVPFWGKPPLHTWLSALGMKLFGVGPLGARIFIFVPSLIVVGLTYFWVRQHKGANQALLATAVMASSLMFFGASAYVMTDMVMVLGTTLSMVGFYNCLMAANAKRFWGWMFFTGLAIGLLAKGPVAVVLTGIPLAPWILFSGRWRRLTMVPWISGIILLLALTLPWYIAAEIKTPGFLNYFIIGEHYERFVVSGWQGDLYGSGHARPKGIIWLFALFTFLPWTFFALALLFRPISIKKTISSDHQGWHSYLFLWMISPLLLFTPAANLLPAYVLPGVPATAALLVSLWAGVWPSPGKWARGLAAFALAFMTVLLLVVAVLTYVSPTTISSRSERELVAHAHSIDTDLHFTYWGERSFSAEFYARGRVDFSIEPAEFEALSNNNRRDAVVLLADQDPQLILDSSFEPAGQFSNRLLFIEQKPDDAS